MCIFIDVVGLTNWYTLVLLNLLLLYKVVLICPQAKQLETKYLRQFTKSRTYQAILQYFSERQDSFISL